MYPNQGKAGAMGALDSLMGAQGGQVLMGADQIVGALRNNPQLAERVKEAILARNAGIVKEQEYSDLKRLYLPIPVTSVGAGATGSINIQPQDLFLTKRIVIPSGIAGDFRLTDFKVGQKPQYAQDGSVPCTCMSEVTVNGDVDFDSANVGNIINIRPENTSAGALDFEGTLIGLAARTQ